MSEPQGDLIDQLERLANFRDSGVLSPEEFERQKRKILETRCRRKIE